MAGRAKIIQRFMSSAFAKKRWPDDEERRRHARLFADANVDLDETNDGFLVDLSHYTFDAKDPEPTWIHAITVGEYDHPYYDNVNFDEKRIQRFEQSVKEKHTGIDPDIDFEHKGGHRGGAAAGWVKDAKSVLTDDDVAMMSDLSGLQLDASDDRDHRGLWVLVDWTKTGREALANGEYRYFSPELAEEWQHPKKGTKFQDVFMGGGITNRPFLKDLTPLNFEDALDAWEKQKTTSEEEDGVKLSDVLNFLSMSREDACTALELSADATDEQIVEAAKTRLLTAPPAPAPKPADPPRLPKKLSDDPEVKAFFESMTTELAAVREDNAELSARLLESDTDNAIAQLFDGRLALSDDGEDAEKKTLRALPPVVMEEVKDLRMALSVDQRQKFDTILKGVVRAGLVSLTAEGSSEVPTMTQLGTAGAQLVTKVKELQAAAKKDGKTLSFSEGVKQLSADEPELVKAWQAEQRPRSA